MIYVEVEVGSRQEERGRCISNSLAECERKARLCSKVLDSGE